MLPIGPFGTLATSTRNRLQNHLDADAWLHRVHRVVMREASSPRQQRRHDLPTNAALP
uniref:Uncharacterized protein n=1 Tax=Hyaloperonospora arabidopsidis (strain Emoy2) TaxID=559515 RepID=M4B636_HYAAE